LIVSGVLMRRGICSCQLPDKDAKKSDKAYTWLKRKSDATEQGLSPPLKLQGDSTLVGNVPVGLGLRRKSLSFNFSINTYSDAVSTRDLSITDVESASQADLEVGPEIAENGKYFQNPETSEEPGAPEEEDSAAGVWIQVENALAKDREASLMRELGRDVLTEDSGTWMSPVSQNMRLRLSQLEMTKLEQSISQMDNLPTAIPAPTGNASGLGVLLVRKTPDSICVVKDMHPCGIAAMDGRIKIEDELLSVDALPCHGRSLEDIGKSLNQKLGSGTENSKLQLRLRRNHEVLFFCSLNVLLAIAHLIQIHHCRNTNLLWIDQLLNPWPPLPLLIHLGKRCTRKLMMSTMIPWMPPKRSI
jgi:hypothetical protein